MRVGDGGDEAFQGRAGPFRQGRGTGYGQRKQDLRTLAEGPQQEKEDAVARPGPAAGKEKGEQGRYGPEEGAGERPGNGRASQPGCKVSRGRSGRERNGQRRHVSRLIHFVIPIFAKVTINP